ncbi:DUF2993 domain-containing protein [Kitasatospora sp. RB6PN24]|uniref:LmeA family phospholipid-binding protein n=1 Tax=Kitasatospora humi TaxID=2893891 RepID=UPI001E3BCA5E|nr:DUF2993 domain-containing protein [Kitasatospora humi]MCC9306620.1 DUF2993 domain-containing protein [Kitasatospora humi]
MRTWIKVTVPVVLLAGLLVGADRVAVTVAEDQAADKLAGHQGISGRPTVSIDDVPFLTDLIDQKLGKVSLSASSMTLSGTGGQSVQLHDFRADLSGVKVNSGYTSATVDSGSGRGLVGYQEVHDLMGLDPRISLGYGGPGLVKVGYQVFGQTMSSTVTLKNDGNTIKVGSIGKLPSGLGGLPGVGGLIQQDLGAKDFTLQGLPVGLHLDTVTPQPGGIELSFVGSGVTLTS